MTTIADYLRTQFGERAAFVEGFDHPSLGGSMFSGAEMAIGESGQPYVSCGGDSLIAFKPPPTSFVQAYIRTPNPIYLVYDDSEGRSWSARQARGEVGYGVDHSHRPNAKLRLVQAG